MFKKLLLVIISILLIIPIFYIALCIHFDLNILKSLYLLNDLYYQSFVYKSKLKGEVYISLVYGFIPLWISLLNLLQKKIKETYGYAKFATRKTILKMGLNFSTGFCLGIYGNNKFFVDDRLSIFIIAAPGTGKTTSIIIPNLLSLKTSVIVLDIKGELEKMTSRYRKEVLNNKIFVFNPFGNNNTFYFNPFDSSIISNFHFDETLALVKEVANVLFEVEKGQDPHWINNAKKLFIFYAIYDIQKNGETNLFEIMRYPNKDELELLSEEYLQMKEEIEKLEEVQVDVIQLFFKQASDDLSLDSIVRDMAREFERANRKEFKSFVTTFGGKMEVFQDRRIAKIVQGMSFKYSDLRKENISLYICVKEKHTDVLSPLIRMMIELIGKNLLDEENNKDDERITWFLEEFTRFKKLDFLVIFPTLARSYNMPCVFVTQTEAQVEKEYSLVDLRIIAGACYYKVMFTINDTKTAESMAKEIGTLTRNKVSETSQDNRLIDSKSKSLEKYFLLTEQDLMNIPKDEVIISVFGFKANPIKAKINYYFKDRKLKNIIKKYERKDTTIEVSFFKKIFKNLFSKKTETEKNQIFSDKFDSVKSLDLTINRESGINKIKF